MRCQRHQLSSCRCSAGCRLPELTATSHQVLAPARVWSSLRDPAPAAPDCSMGGSQTVISQGVSSEREGDVGLLLQVRPLRRGHGPRGPGVGHIWHSTGGVRFRICAWGPDQWRFRGVDDGRRSARRPDTPCARLPPPGSLGAPPASGAWRACLGTISRAWGAWGPDPRAGSSSTLRRS